MNKGMNEGTKGELGKTIKSRMLACLVIVDIGEKSIEQLEYYTDNVV